MTRAADGISRLCGRPCSLPRSGQTQKEDVLTGAAAAAAGGYATVICMANTVPTCDTPEIIRYVTDKAKDCPVQVLQAGSSPRA